MNSIFITALLMGLTGSLHCAGMCGPIVLFMPFHGLAGIRKWLAIAVYHFGRISVYALMGLLLLSFKSAFHPQWQQRVSIIAGVLLLVIGLMSFTGKKLLPIPFLNSIYGLWGKLIAKPSEFTLFIAGLINGALPCGLVYMALSLSMAATDWVEVIGVLYTFGLGTLPMLVAVTLLGQKVRAFIKPTMLKLVPVTLFLFAGLFILRGMNLGIPFLSPKVSIENQEIKSSCCHKPAATE